MSFIVREVVDPSDEVIDVGTAVLDEAFNHQFFLHAVGGDQSLTVAMLRSHITAAKVDGHVYYAEEAGSEKVVGVAVWFGPGKEFLSTPEQCGVGWDQIMDKLESKYSEWWTYFLVAYAQMSEDALGAEVKLGSYQLQLFGILPEYQNKGIGRSMIRVVEERAKKEGRPVCVETAGESGVKRYESMGFTSGGSAAIKSPGGSEFTMYALIKRTVE